MPEKNIFRFSTPSVVLIPIGEKYHNRTGKAVSPVYLIQLDAGQIPAITVLGNIRWPERPLFLLQRNRTGDLLFLKATSTGRASLRFDLRLNEVFQSNTFHNRKQISGQNECSGFAVSPGFDESWLRISELVTDQPESVILPYSVVSPGGKKLTEFMETLAVSGFSSGILFLKNEDPGQEAILCRKIADTLGRLMTVIRQETTLENLRKELLAVDERIMSILLERYRITGRMGEVKKAEGIPVFRPVQWEKQIRALLGRGRHSEACIAYLTGIFNRIHRESVKQQMSLIRRSGISDS